MKIAMIGSGYVGLVSGVCFADFGHKVTCIDVDADKIGRLQAGDMPIYEPGLKELVAKNVREKRLSFSTSLKEGMKDAEAIFIAVGTPSRRGDGHADLSYVYQAAEDIAREMNGYVVIVTKSTVPVGTGDAVEDIIRKQRPEADFAVVSNPEFLREGAAINDFKRPDRIVIGTMDGRARDVMSEIYRPLYLNQSPILFTDRRTSELIKYAANAFLAMKITFINEMADLCEAVGGNVQDVARGIGLDNRIGSKFLHAGPGYGGSCFPKDTQALARTAQEAGAPVHLVETTIAVNIRRKKAMAQRVIKACGGSVQGKTITILGLTFKPNTDDMRDAPALDIIPALQNAGASIRAHDPEGMEHAKSMLEHVTFCDDAYDAAHNADAVVIVTEWDAYRALDFTHLRESMKTPVLVDMRNIYRQSEMVRTGFTYIGIGRKN
jgi:UDPglucose 6-dehydrogenase